MPTIVSSVTKQTYLFKDQTSRL